MKRVLSFLLVIVGTTFTCTQKEALTVPSLAGVSPKSSLAGQDILLTGTFLRDVTHVNFEQNSGAVSSLPSKSDDTSLTVTVPALNPGNVNIFVESKSGKSNVLSFVVLVPGPSIRGFIPSKSKVGDIVTILGAELDQVTEVRFGDGRSSPAQFTVGDDKLMVKVPADALTGKICLKSGGDNYCSTDNFAVLRPPSDITLSRDKGVKDNVIEIYGSNLTDAKVFFGEIQGQVAYNDGSTIKVHCPEFKSIREVKLVVKNSLGEVGTKFTGAPAAQITLAIPGGFIPGSALTLKGVDFYDVAAVIINSGNRIDRSEFILRKQDEVLFKVPFGTTRLDLQIANQYGEGQLITLPALIAGSGLNSDNIGFGTAQLTSVGMIARSCNPIEFGNFEVRYQKSNGEILEEIFTSRQYETCICSTTCKVCLDGYGSDATEFSPYSQTRPCNIKDDPNVFYGSVETIGGQQYRNYDTYANCPSGDLIPADPLAPVTYYKCKGSRQQKFAASIKLEISKRGTTIEKDEYTGFMIAYIQVGNRGYFASVYSPGYGEFTTEMFVGAKSKTGEYLLESTNGSGNQLRVNF